jgi:transcriptional regulator GlxA family with amidase domain
MRGQYSHARRIRPISTGFRRAGTFLLAEAGILDGLHATTSWWLSPAFRSRYPAVHLDEGRMVVASDGITTAGAAFGHVDLALAVVRTTSPAVADLVTRYLVLTSSPRLKAGGFQPVRRVGAVIPRGFLLVPASVSLQHPRELQILGRR